MGGPGKTQENWREYFTPRKLGFLAVSWICFCVCLALLALGMVNRSWVLLLLVSGACSVGGVVGSIVAVRKRRSAN